MKKTELNQKMKGLFFWQGWHPEVALRYLPVVDEIKKIKTSPTIMDIGSGGLGIAPYYGKKVTGVDIRFRPPYHPKLERIRASALKLPFADKVYDVVTAVDAFEHLEPGDRAKAIKEMLRTAKKMVVIAVPCGESAHIQDKKLSSLYRRKYGKKYHFFEEQIRYGLPEEKDFKDVINDAADQLKLKISMKILDNENLKLREFLMKGWMSKNILLEIIFRKILLFAIPVFKLMNHPPVYRKIFVVNIK